jgi:hypothetical protein
VQRTAKCGLRLPAKNLCVSKNVKPLAFENDKSKGFYRCEKAAWGFEKDAGKQAGTPNFYTANFFKTPCYRTADAYTLFAPFLVLFESAPCDLSFVCRPVS